MIGSHPHQPSHPHLAVLLVATLIALVLLLLIGDRTVLSALLA